MKLAAPALGVSRLIAASVLVLSSAYPTWAASLYVTPDGSGDYPTIRQAMTALATAIDKAKSADPAKVALALENLRFEDDSGEVTIRADNHQLVQPLYISTLVKANGKDVRFDVEKTGLGFRTDARVEGKDTVMATTCKFQRP